MVWWWCGVVWWWCGVVVVCPRRGVECDVRDRKEGKEIEKKW
jgi:hypothetical protein